MTWWLVFRMVKFAAVGIFAAGCIGAVAAQRQERRIFFAHWLAALGLLGTWVAGYGLMKATGQSLKAPWIWSALILSFIAFHGAVLYARRAQPRFVSGVLAIGAYLACIGVMVTRLAGSTVMWTTAFVSILLGAALTHLWQTETEPASEEHQGEVTWHWFCWIARAEGLSLVLMMCVSMPVRMIWKIRLDGGQGWIGWVHGILVVIFLQALLSARKALGWSGKRTLLGFVASLIPLGTFVFEKSVAKNLEEQASS